MPNPSAALTTLRPDIAGMFTEFDLEMNQRGFISNRVFPVLEVAAQAGKYGKIPVEQLLQQRDTARAPGSGYSRGTFKFTSASYATDENGTEEVVDDRESRMYANYFDAEVIAAARAFNMVLQNQEQRVAAAVFNATTFTSNTTAVTNEWDDVANADPAADIEAAVRAIYAASGLWPDSLIINRTVFRNLRNCEAIIDRVKYQGFMDVRAGNISVQQLAAVFDIPNIIVAGSSKNTANEAQAAVFAQNWSNEYAMVAKLCRTNDIREPGLGRTFHWGEDGSTIGGTFESYRDETVRGDVVRVRHDTDEQILFVEAGHLLSNITT